MKASTFGFRPALPAVLATQVVFIGFTKSTHLPGSQWWVGETVTTALAAALLLITVHGRNAPGWLVKALQWRIQRRKPRPAAVAVDITHGDLVCGVRVDHYEAITMINVAGKPYIPTFLRGSSVSLTTNVLPLKLLAGLLDHADGLRCSIDVVASGFRVRRGNRYPALYATLLAGRAAAGRRTTQLIVRLDLLESVGGIRYRQSIGAAAAAVTERIVNELLQQHVRATALSADELDTALHKLGAGLTQLPGKDADRIPQVGWSSINTGTGYLTSYYFSPEDITNESINRMWSLPSDEVVQLISLHKQDGDVMVSTLVRTNDPQPPPQPPTLYLNTLPGEQYAAALRAAPTGRPRLQLPSRRLDETDLTIPVGATGILVGAAAHDDPSAQPPIQRDDMMMLALTDPHRPTRIMMDTSIEYARQLLIRAAAVGELVAIYTSDPQRWESVTSDPNIAVVDGAAPFVPSIIVNDHPTTPAPAGLSATVITMGFQPEFVEDIAFMQRTDSTVEITTAARTIETAIVAFRREEVWVH